MKNKTLYTIWASLVVMFFLVLILFCIPIQKEVREHQDISIQYEDNKYEVKLKQTNENITIKKNDIKVRYVNGYVSKNGRKAHLEEYTIKTIVGYRKSYKLIITETID